MTRVRIVHNRLLGGWFIVRGRHDTPIGGRFESRAAAKAHLDARRNADVEKRAKAFALKALNASRAEANLPPLKAVPALWWSYHGAEWIANAKGAK